MTLAKSEGRSLTFSEAELICSVGLPNFPNNHMMLSKSGDHGSCTLRIPAFTRMCGMRATMRVSNGRCSAGTRCTHAPAGTYAWVTAGVSHVGLEHALWLQAPFISTSFLYRPGQAQDLARLLN